MGVRLLVALTSEQEARFVTTLGPSRETEVARRCADVADLLAAAHAGLGTHAALSPDLPHLDRDVVGQLSRHRLGLLGVVSPADEAGERRLRQLGVQKVVTGDAELAAIETALSSVGTGGPASGSGSAGGLGSSWGPGSGAGLGAVGVLDGDAVGPGPIDPLEELLADPAHGSSGDVPAAAEAWLRSSRLDADHDSDAPDRGVADGQDRSSQDLDARIDAALAGDLDALRRQGEGSTASEGGGGRVHDATSAESAEGRVHDLDPAVPEVDDADARPRRAQLVAVWGPVGSPGRTTLAVNVAAECARAGLRTLLLDADTYGASVAQHLGLLDDTPGLAAAARAAEQGSLDAPGLERRAIEVMPRLRVLTGLPRADRWPEVRDGAMRAILDTARLIADVVVVDCGFSLEADEELSYDTLAPRRNATTLATLDSADHLLVVGAGDPVGLQRLVQGLAELAHVPSPPPVVVVNKVRASAAGPRPGRAIQEVLGRFSGLDDVALVPDDRDACDGAMLAGRTLGEYAPNSKTRSAIREVTRRILPDLVPAATSRRSLRRRR